MSSILTPRQREILLLSCCTGNEIAYRLGISAQTVKNQFRDIFEALNVDSKLEQQRQKVARDKGMEVMRATSINVGGKRGTALIAAIKLGEITLDDVVCPWESIPMDARFYMR